MPKVLFIIAHPDLEGQSLCNKTIVDTYKKLSSNTEYDDLYKLYPDYKIDVQKEQEKLKNADIVVLQFPYYWYNAPSLLRKWFEDVLVRGFSHGSTGKALAGKRLLVSFTTGALTEAYREGGVQNFTLDDLTKGFHQLANLCSMKYEGYITTGGFGVIHKDDPEGYKALIDRLEKHGKELAEKVKN